VTLHCAPRIITATEFSGDMKELITQWKFRHRTSVTRQLALIAVEALHRVLPNCGVDVVTWAPTSDRRRRLRGYDQSELLAQAMARRLKVPCRHLLVRVGDSPQTGRGRLERLSSAPRFRARPVGSGRQRSCCEPPIRVLVIDDVVTTGSTLRSAGATLTKAGYGPVVLLALARTPG
jgi:ComF family protein